jgi:hydroxypyruvate isomerase
LLAQHWQRIGHLQFADYPGRGAPGSGTLDFASLFSQIKALPYAFWSGAEYRDNNGDMQWLASLPASRLMLHCGTETCSRLQFLIFCHIS